MNHCMFCGNTLVLTPEQRVYAMVHYPRLLYVCDECWQEQRDKVVSGRLMKDKRFQEYVATRVLENALELLRAPIAAGSATLQTLPTDMLPDASECDSSAAGGSDRV